MARGGVSPFPLDIPVTSSSSSTNNNSGEQAASPTSAPRPPSLVLPQPVQRLLDFGSGGSGRERDMVPTRSKSATTPRSTAEQPPALTVKLSGPSFLDTVIRDTVTKDPLYIIETTRDLTHVYRLDASRREAGKAASIQWPQTVSASSKGKGRSGKTVQMSNGSWRDTEEFLKAGPLGNLASRKFTLPHYPHSLKWKLIPGDCYVCGTSGIKGPVAVLDAATLSAPPRLRIYQTLTAPDLARSQQNHAGVPFLLLDYLVVTSLLLTTTTQEWLDRPADAHLPGSSSRSVKKWLAIIHPERAEELQQKDKDKGREKETEEREPQSPGGTLGPGSSLDGSTPVTPSSGRGARPWEAHMSWSSGSGSGGSETVISPSTPGTSLSSNSQYHLPPRYSGSHLVGMHNLNNSQTQFQYKYEMSGSYPDLQSPPQRRFQVTNPEPTPEYEYESAPESHPQLHRHLTAPEAGIPQEMSPRPSLSSQSYPYSFDDGRPSTASSVSSLGITAQTPIASTPTNTVPLPGGTGSLRRPPRQLPRPPVPQDPYAAQQPQNSLGLSQVPDRQRVSSTPPSFHPAPPLQIPTSSFPNSPAQGSPFTPAHASARSLARRSLGGRPIPPPPPPPVNTLPLPPKLAAEYANTPASGAGPSASGNALAGQMQGMAISRPPPPQAYYPPVGAGYGSPPDGGAHVDAGRVRASFAHVPRDAETESVYEMPPPAYDAIDFSLRLPGQSQRRAP